MANRITATAFVLIPGMSEVHHNTNEFIPNKTEVRVSYCEGGHNYYNGGKNPQGIRITFSDVEKYTDYCTSSILGGGMAFTVLATTRYNEKKIKVVFEAIKPSLNDLCDLWRKKDTEALKAKLLELVTGL